MVDQAPNNLGAPTQEATTYHWILQQLNIQSTDLARQTAAIENLTETVKGMPNDLKEVNSDLARQTVATENLTETVKGMSNDLKEVNSDLARQTVATENLTETVKGMSNDLKGVNKSVNIIQLRIAFGIGFLACAVIAFSAVMWFVDKSFDQIIQAVSKLV